MEKGKSFFGGLPTEFDVKKMFERFGIPEPTQIISYDDIETCIAVKKNSFRFRTVTNAWRKQMELKHNLIFKAIPGNGFECLNPSGRVDFSFIKHGRGLKQVAKATNIAATTERTNLNPEELRRCDYVQNIGGTIKVMCATARKQLVYPDPVKQEASV